MDLRQLLERGRGNEALAEALVAWRRSRSPALSRLISTLGDRSTDRLPVPDGKGKKVDQAWVDLARNATDAQLSGALAALVTHLKTARFSWPIVELLGNRDADPRIATAALALLSDLKRVRHTSGKLVRRLVECVERHGDRSHAVLLKPSRIASDAGATPTRLANVKKRLLSKGSEADAELDELSNVATTAPLSFGQAVTTQGEGDSMLAAVYEEPSDDARRLVYADWLSEQGDPRGEFIQLQFLKKPAKKDAARMDALQRKHAFTWYKRIWPALAKDRTQLHGPLVFERGFLAAAVVYPPKRPPSDLWNAPEWSTVVVLRGRPVVTEVMRSLRRKKAVGRPGE